MSPQPPNSLEKSRKPRPFGSGPGANRSCTRGSSTKQRAVPSWDHEEAWLSVFVVLRLCLYQIQDIPSTRFLTIYNIYIYIYTILDSSYTKAVESNVDSAGIPRLSRRACGSSLLKVPELQRTFQSETREEHGSDWPRPKSCHQLCA